jgi:hypothetical protein
MTMTKDSNMHVENDKVLMLVNELVADGHNFVENPVVFKWRYEEHPNLQFSLYINTNVADVNFVPPESPSVQ